MKNAVPKKSSSVKMPPPPPIRSKSPGTMTTRMRVLLGDGSESIRFVTRSTRPSSASARRRWAARTRHAPTLVSEIMTNDVLCVREDVGVETIRLLFVEKGISGAPVVDDQGKPVGVISKTDLVRDLPAILRNAPVTDEVESEPKNDVEWRIGDGASRPLAPGFHTERLPATTVWEIMMPLAFTLSMDATVAQAAALMAHEGIHRIVIVGTDGTVAGILTSLDVARWVGELEVSTKEDRERARDALPI